MNAPTMVSRPQLHRLGESTCHMLSFQDMVNSTVKEKAMPVHEVTVTIHCEPSSPVKKPTRPHLEMFGESTCQLLAFDDIVESPVKETRRPRVRIHRSMYATTDSKRNLMESSGPVKDATKKVRNPKRRVHKSRSMPQVPEESNGRGKWERTFLEVAPGYSVELCGAAETMDAYKKDQVIHTECGNCDCFLYCINIADMVLCPECRSISAVDASKEVDGSNTEKMGLGLTIELVMEESCK